jgi:hypothetical protein
MIRTGPIRRVGSSLPVAAEPSARFEKCRINMLKPGVSPHEWLKQKARLEQQPQLLQFRCVHTSKGYTN